jgi:uncharacterized protein YbbC (DUF1343 family)
MRRQSARASGNVRGRRAFPRLLLAVVWPALSGCGAVPEDGSANDAAGQVPNGASPSVAPPDVGAVVRPGIDVLLTDSVHLVEGRRVGLVTNHTGIDASGVSSIDRLFGHPGVELVALFAPEHGIRGTAEAGAQISSEVDAETGLPIHSLYGDTLRPTPESLEGIDVLLFDIQDIGTRYYTYVSTMAYAMESAGEAGIPFVVLDRPNPIGGELVQGNVLEPAFSSFVGLYPIPMRHGMTPGELARLFSASFGVNVEVHVVPADGWSRSMLFPDTGLPWRAPSPNMPDVTSALHYPGTCLFEGTNLSVGRGTDRPFQWVGAPWIDGDALAATLSGLGLPGVTFEPVRFTPVRPGDGKFDGVEVGGVRLQVTDAATYDPTRTAVALLVEARRMSGDAWEWNVTHFDRLAGTQALRIGVEGGDSPDEILADWPAQIEEFLRIRQGNLIYQ